MAAIVYFPNIPQPTDQLSASQPQILANFQGIEDFVDVDHADFSTMNAGEHNKITFPAQAAVPVFAAGKVGLYNKIPAAPYPLSGVGELFIVNSAGVTTPLTNSNALANGWAYLPSGILLKWGSGSANGLTTITFPVGANIPAFTTIFSMQISTAYISVTDNDGFVRLNNFIAPFTQFTVFGSARTTVTTKAVAFQYLAIGN